MNRPPVNRQKTRLVHFFRSVSSKNNKRNIYVHMFKEDIALDIMPIGGRSRNQPEFAVNLLGDEKDVAVATSLLKSISENNHRNLDAVICAAVSKIATNLTGNGACTYELVKDSDGFASYLVTSTRTYRLPFVTVQVIPRAERDIWKRRYVFCKNTRLWKISIPRAVGGAQGFRRTIHQLRKIPNGSTPEFVLNDLQAQTNFSHFDFSDYHRRQIAYIIKSTAHWNWHRRDWSDDGQSEYYRTYKRAKFKYAQAILREHILSELNILFHKINLDCHIQVSGLPSPSEINDILDQLHQGSVNFGEVYRRTGT